jgi:hypothetical protein
MIEFVSSYDRTAASSQNTSRPGGTHERVHLHMGMEEEYQFFGNQRVRNCYPPIFHGMHGFIRAKFRQPMKDQS